MFGLMSGLVLGVIDCICVFVCLSFSVCVCVFLYVSICYFV